MNGTKGFYTFRFAYKTSRNGNTLWRCCIFRTKTTEQAVIDAIPFDRAAPVSELLEKTGLAVADLLPILLALQMKKAAEELPGGYIRCAAAFSAL